MRLIWHVERFYHVSLRFPFLGDAEEVLAAKNTFIGIGAKHCHDCAVILLGCFRAKRIHIAM